MVVKRIMQSRPGSCHAVMSLLLLLNMLLAVS
jgi:hypothetical protein